MTMRRWLLAWIAAVIVMTGATAPPAFAHKDHHKKPVAQAQQVATPGTAVAQSRPVAMAPGEMADEPPIDRSKMPTMERMFDWFGRLHTIIVHFPIAFFPAALFTAIVWRRRPAFAAPVQFLIVAGGIIAPIAAVLGWLDSGFDFSSDDWLLHYHRWLGTGIGAGSLLLAIWALRRPEDVRGSGMIIGLSLITAALVVQGWFGGAMVHGMGHMNW